ncbi:unnamed protein product, partial [marine sediment metagenome]
FNSGHTRVGSVTGDVITLGADTDFIAGEMRHTAIAAVDTDKYVMALWKIPDNRGWAWAATAAGLAPTVGIPKQFSLGAPLEIEIGKLDTNKFVIVYNDFDVHDIYGIVGTTIGSTNI